MSDLRVYIIPKDWQIGGAKSEATDVVEVVERSAYERARGDYDCAHRDRLAVADLLAQTTKERDEARAELSEACAARDQWKKTMRELNAERAKSTRLVSALEYAEGQLLHAGYSKAAAVVKKALAEFKEESAG